jgi:hypothetical protein
MWNYPLQTQGVGIKITPYLYFNLKNMHAKDIYHDNVKIANMDKLTQYRNYVQQLINEYAKYRPSYGDIEVETIFDTQHDHYQLIYIGWNDEQRVHGCSLHIDIKNGKIWLQHNGTENHIAQELVALGVPKEDIVLGFQAQHKRQFTGFATM